MQLAEIPRADGSPAARAVRAARQELRLLVRSRLDERRLAPPSLVAEARARGVRVRAVHPLGAPGPAGAPADAVRAAASVPAAALIVDVRLALVLDAAGAAVAVGHPALVAALSETFELVWSGAGAPRAGAEARRDDAIVALLGAGFTDDEVAARIGTSARTVRRRVAALMREAGVRTRFQAGAEAVRRGWL